ncbi:Inositol polyphosphate kinase family protein [Aphelenchoides avenae]|nr:Inositol polyphosphate kinase family protein [Aphelenchus avenae]
MKVSGFHHQVGGHWGLFTCAGHVCKPLNQREFAFYTQMDQRLRPYTAKCCGRIKVHLTSNTDGTLSMCTHSELPVDCHRPQTSTLDTDRHPMTFRVISGRVEAEKAINAWAGQCQSKIVQKLLKGYDKCFVLLEDIVSGYEKPCVIDLKMGTRQYGDDANDQKRLSQTQKCRTSTSKKLGVRMVGMQLYDADAQRYRFVNKYEGRRMDEPQFRDALAQYFFIAGEERTKRVIKKLKELRTILEAAKGFRFFSSSILIAFDGALVAEESADEAPGEQNSPEPIGLRMIDFAHSTFSGFFDDRQYTGPDDGYLLGVDSLIRMLTEILESGNDAIQRSPILAPESALTVRHLLKRRYSDTDETTDDSLMGFDPMSPAVATSINSSATEGPTMEKVPAIVVETPKSDFALA